MQRKSEMSTKPKPGSQQSKKQAPKVICKRSRRKSPNDDVSNERRQQLLELIIKTNSIRRAANQLGINNSTAKSIFYKYKQTGQIHKNPRTRLKDEPQQPDSIGSDLDLGQSMEVKTREADQFPSKSSMQSMQAPAQPSPEKKSLL